MALLTLLRRPAAPVAAADTAAPSDPAATAPDPAPVSELVDLVGEDIRRTRQSIEAASRTMSDKMTAGEAGVAAVVAEADGLAAAVVAAVENVDAMAGSLDTIAAAGDAIGVEMEGASKLAEAARGGVDRAGAGVADLQGAIERIETVVALIAKVAKQTNLLALNATIEAERAGAAGRGFAVVAQEVKALSVETQRATDEIRTNIAAVEAAAARTFDTVGDVVEIISQITPRFGAVSDAVERQTQLITEAGRRATETRSFVESVAHRAGDMKAKCASVADGVGGVRVAADQLASTSVGAMTRLATVLRQTPEGDRRRHDRFPAALPLTIAHRGGRRRIETIDVSRGGLLLPAGAEPPVPGERLDVELDGVGALRGRCVGVSAGGVHVAFDEPPAEIAARLEAKLGTIRAGYQEMIDRCTQAARQIGEIFTASITRGEISEAHLFDTDYRPVPGTDPVQVETRAMDYLERTLAALQENIVTTDPRMVFAAAVDRNGWLAVHNRAFAKPQRRGDVAWNTANSRNKRIFDDRTGLLAARNTRPFIIQAYVRDMGGGVTVLMKEVDAPIHAAGRHWGGFRTAYKM